MRIALVALAACGASMAGTVRSADGPLAGVTVIAAPLARSPDGVTLPAGATTTAITGNDGRYHLDLASDRYLVVFFYAELTYHRVVDVRAATTVDQRMDEHGPHQMTCTGADACEPLRK